MRETAEELSKNNAIEKVIFACFDESVYTSYLSAIQAIR
jgi:O-acetyl-ADP-ribose deacetylase (regulator of RNase III)